MSTHDPRFESTHDPRFDDDHISSQPPIDPGGMDVGGDVETGGDINGDIDVSGTTGGESLSDPNSDLYGNSYVESLIGGGDAAAENYNCSETDSANFGSDTASGEECNEADVQSGSGDAAPACNSSDGFTPNSDQIEKIECMSDALETATRNGVLFASLSVVGSAASTAAQLSAPIVGPGAVGVGVMVGAATFGISLYNGVSNCGNSR